MQACLKNGLEAKFFIFLTGREAAGSEVRGEMFFLQWCSPAICFAQAMGLMLLICSVAMENPAHQKTGASSKENYCYNLLLWLSNCRFAVR